MELKIFLVGVVLFFLICAAVVAHAAYKGRDWRVAAMFMSVGFLIAVGQLEGGLK